MPAVVDVLKNFSKFDGKQDWWILLLVNLLAFLWNPWTIFSSELFEIFKFVYLQSFQVNNACFISLLFFYYAVIEINLHPGKISMKKVFSEAVNYFSQESSAIDVLQDPGYASEPLLQNHEKHCDHYCVKSDQIRSYFWSVFSCIRTKYLRLQSEYRKIWTRNNSAFGHFSGSACGVFAWFVLMGPFAWMFLCFVYLMEFFIKVFHEGFQLTFTCLKSATIKTPEHR